MPVIDSKLIPTNQPRTLAGPVLLNPRAVAAQQEIARTAIEQHNSDRSDTHQNVADQIAIESFKQKYGYDPRNPPATNKDNIPVGEAALQDLSPADQAMVKAITIGKVPVTPYAMARSPQFANLVQHAFAYEPGTDLTLFQRRNAAYSKFFAPNSPNARVNQALQHLEIFRQAANELNNYNSSSIPGVSLAENLLHESNLRGKQAGAIRGFETTRNAVATELAAAFKGGNNPAEAQIVRDLQATTAHDSPQQFAEVIHRAAQLLGGRIDANQYNAQQLLGPNATMDDLMTPQAKAAYERFSDINFGKNPQDLQPKELSTTEQAFKLPPGYQEDHANFIQNAAGKTITPQDYIDFRNAEDKKFGVQSDLNPKVVEDLVSAINAGQIKPDQPVPVGSSKIGPMGQTIQGILQGPVGTGVTAAANAATAGLPELLMNQGDRDALHMQQAAHPIAAGVGDVAGSVLPIGGLESGAARLLEKLPLNNIARAKFLTGVGANAAYGGVRGFNDADTGSGLSGLGLGTAEGAAGGAFGQFVGSGVNRLLPDQKLIALSKLTGVDLTTLQRLGLGHVENAFNALPGVRTAVSNAEESMNVDNANRLLKNIGDKLPDNFPGSINDATARNNYIYNAANNAYEKVKPFVNGSRDADFENAMKAIETQNTGTSELTGLYQPIKDAYNSAFDENGMFNGNKFQKAKTLLQDTRQNYVDDVNNPNLKSADRLQAKQMADAALAATNQLDALAQRKLPAAVYQDLQNADSTWAGMRQILNSSKAALPGREGVYAPADMLRTDIRFDPSIDANLTTRGQSPDQDYALAAQKIMGSSPAPAKAGWLPTTTAGGIGAGLLLKAPAAAGLLGGGAVAAYAPVVKRITQAILTGQRPDMLANPNVMNAYADAMRYILNNNAQSGGQ